jgi:hypothetical protein
MTTQRILVVQQGGKGTRKVAALRRRGEGLAIAAVFDLPVGLPPVVDDAGALLPAALDADLVLAFIGHPDLATDLARLCERRGVPLVASGQKVSGERVFAPPT